MNITLGIGPLVSLLAGILILVMPRLLNVIVAVYLIVIGLLGLFGTGHMKIAAAADPPRQASTISVPLISSWPLPQNTSQTNV